ncbi:recombinase family protein [Providencia sp.]|uniref:recombinase family protein n=1 Tax=Providencia sp. TaxID=589 RepID=UPI0035ADFBEA
MKKLKAHAYMRISKINQRDGSGLEEQRSRIDKYINENSVLFDSNIRYWEDIGKSAFTGRNMRDGELSKFIEEVNAGSIGAGDALIIYSLDRLTRRSSWEEDMIPMLVKKGVEIHDVSTPIVLKRNDQMSKIIMELIVTRAHNESIIKSERSIAGWNRRLKDTLEKGAVFTRKIPFWLNVIDNKYIINKEKVDVIVRIFDYYSNGLSSTMIARRFNEEGIKSMAGSLWRPNGITKLIKDERLRGYLRRSKDNELIPNIFPVIIDEKLFDMANRILKKNAKGIKGRPRENNKTREVNNILTGMLRCGKCGARVTTSKNGRGVRYIVCLNRKNHEICGEKSVRMQELEHLIIMHAQKIDLAKIHSYIQGDVSNEDLYKDELLDLEEDEKHFLAKIKERKNEGKVASFILINGLVEVRNKIEEIKQKIKDIGVHEEIPEIKHDHIEELMDPSNVDLRMTLRKFLTQIVDIITIRNIDNKRLIEIIYHSDVYRHILITDKNCSNLEQEIKIINDNGVIIYSTNDFSIELNENTGEYTFHGIDKVKVTAYYLLINYMTGLKGTSKIIADMHNNSHMVINNGL